MSQNENNLTPEQEMDHVIAQIRDYARSKNLNAAQVRQLLDVGIVAKGVLDLPSGTMGVRDLTSDEIAALDDKGVAKNNSASLERLMGHRSTRG